MQPLPVGTLVAQRYRVIGEIGRGGMGVVYRVEHVHTGQQHALKVLNVPTGLSEELVLRFKREARAPARIKSEHVVTVTDADVMPELGNAPFLVMELLDGVDLEHVIEERVRLTPREVVDALGQVARVLDKAHALGIVHRDLKPENLFFHRREDGTTLLKVLDFGISKVSGDEPSALAGALVTRPGALMGTPLYMSPEQAGSGTAVGPASDVWSLGIVAVRLLTGDYYWRAQSMGEMMAQLLRDPLYPPSERWPWLPPGFDVWFQRSCDRAPERRFARASEQVRELAAVLGEAMSASAVPSAPPTPTAPPPTPSSLETATVSELGATTPVDTPESSPEPSPTAPTRRRRAGGLVAAALVCFVAAGLGLARWGSTSPPPSHVASAPAPPGEPSAPASV
ncbi:MAG TPA: serine/threonine-protein kinase, partial [Polyangiaceae bacterium]|nr:serine/threonine-protein kinase [Polyangiaceae bacterium]